MKKTDLVFTRICKVNERAEKQSLTTKPNYSTIRLFLQPFLQIHWSPYIIIPLWEKIKLLGFF